MHLGELHGNTSINDKNNLFENYIPKCYNVKRILISFNCFSEYRSSYPSSTKKNNVKVGPRLTKSSGSAHDASIL